MSSVPTCPTCAATVVRKRPSGPPPTYCSRRCRYVADRARNGDAQNEAKRAANAAVRLGTVKTCPQCSNTFTPTKSLRQKFCGKACSRNFFRDSSEVLCSKCDRPVRAKGLCNMHYKALLRSEGRIKNDPWSDAKRDRYHVRRALKKGSSSSGPVLLTAIAERDSHSCGLCFDAVDMSIAWPDPLSPSLDHVIPLSKGGIHDPSNVQLAHLRCNVSKGNRAA